MKKKELSAKETRKKLVTTLDIVESLPSNCNLSELEEAELNDALQNFINQPHLHILTETQRRILFFMVCNTIGSGIPLTHREIARLCGVNVSSVSRAMLDPAFNAIYTLYVKEVARFHQGEVVNNLYRQSATNPRAAEVYLKYADLITEKIATKNINVNATPITQTNMTPEQNLAMLVETYRTAGYTLDRLITEITNIWNSSSERF